MPGRRGRKRKRGDERRKADLNASESDGKGDAGVDLGGGGGKNGALREGNCVLETSCNVLAGGDMEVHRAPLLESDAKREDLGDGGDPAGDSLGMQSSYTGVEPRFRANGWVERGDGGLPEERTRDFGMGTAGGESMEAEFCAPGKVGQSSKKRKRPSGSGRKKVDPEVPLRRSARRAAITALATPEKFIQSPAKLSNADATPLEENVVDDDKECKLELPPSSKIPNLDGFHVLDFFSVYACLRSFSTSLFLSPFSLEAFVEALNCTFANSLMDNVHFSLLLCLKRRLEKLAEQGNLFASDCLRGLNWELLDLVNWPFYLIEYLLLFHASTMNSCFKLSSLKLLDKDYYKQPGKVKLQILRFLCDDLFEVDSIRAELDGQTINFEPNADVDENFASPIKSEDPISHDLQSLSQFQHTGEDDNNDKNLDECCICKMDGVLICCDGCPAAFHSRCVGVTKDTLPDGDWYCPDCLVGKMKPAKLLEPFRGAELLGIDIDGRIYFGTCGYLLVLLYLYLWDGILNEVINGEVFGHTPIWSDFHGYDVCRYYNRCDIGAVINILSKSLSLNNEITRALSLFRGEEDTQCAVSTFSSYLNCKSAAIETVIERSSYIEASVEMNSVTEETLLHRDHSTTRSRKSIGNHSTLVRVSCKAGGGFSSCSTDPVEDLSLNSVDASMQEECKGKQVPAGLIAVPGKSWSVQMQSEPSIYVNHYSFGRVVSSIAEVILAKMLDAKITKIIATTDDVVAYQLNAISETFVKLGWLLAQRSSLDAQKEGCGWCLPCRSADGQECLLNVTEKNFLKESKNGSMGLRSLKNRKSHFIYAVHHLLLIEENVHGLLSGPWKNPSFKKQWKKTVLKATDVKMLKGQLLLLGSNLRRVALSVDWLKPMPIDLDLIFGSSRYVLTAPVLVPSKNLGGRKRGRKSRSEAFKHKPDAGLMSQVAGSGVFWWRGGKLSRQVFHWKMLPRSLVSKGARQAGHQKLPGLLYHEGSEPTKRSKFLAWQAAVEMSKTVAELLCHVRELDSNIRWNDFKNTSDFLNLNKESTKKRVSSKGVMIRRKCLNGDQVNYILDFGRKKTIPDAITKHAIMHHETSSGRKKYWLNEHDIPLGLLKAFEMRKLGQAFKTKKMDKMMLSDENFAKLSKPKGFSYLFSRLLESEQTKCAQCSEDVLVREAVKCQSCKGVFHSKHFRVPKSVTDAIYACSACKKNEVDTLKERKEKDKAEKKSATAKMGHPLKKKRKMMILGSQKKTKLANKGNKAPHSWIHKDIANCSSLHRRKRTAVQHSYWQNGLLWAVKQNDGRGMAFRLTNILMPNAHDLCLSPVCELCHEEYNPEMIYLCCEKCGDWFHGVAFAVTLENIHDIMAFRCHKCLRRSISLCPCHTSKLVPKLRQLENGDGVCGVGLDSDMRSDEKPHRSECMDDQFSLLSELFKPGASEKTTGEVLFNESQCSSPKCLRKSSLKDQFKTINAEGTSNVAPLCDAEKTQMMGQLEQNAALKECEVICTDDSITDENLNVSVMDTSHNLLPINPEEEPRKFPITGRQVSLEKSEYDAGVEIQVDASLVLEDESSGLKVLQVGLLNEGTNVLSCDYNSPDQHHILRDCSQILGSHSELATMRTSCGDQELSEHSQHTDDKIGYMWNLGYKNQEKSEGGQSQEVLRHDDGLQCSQMFMETKDILEAKKQIP